MKNFTRLLTASTLVLGLVGCGVNSYSSVGLNGSNGKFVAKHRAGAKWTILVHMAAENNLNSAGLKDINEMEAGLNTSDVNVLVLYDGNTNGDSCIYKIKNDPAGLNKTIISDKIDDGGVVIPATHEINSGDPAVLAKFVAWAAEKYPAEHTMLGIWNHGSGLFATNKNLGNGLFPNASRGFAWDDRGGNMNTKDLTGQILPAFTKVAGQPLDVLGFDACLMSHVEIGYQAKGMLNYLVASEDTEPGDGWDYQAWLAAVSANPAMDSKALGSSLVENYAKFYQASSVTLSLTDVNVLNSELVPAINSFASAAVGNMAANKSALGLLRGKTQSFYSSDCGDLGHFAKLVQADSTVGAELKDAAKGIETAMNKTVLAKGNTGKWAANATGLVVYFPRPTQSYNAKYDNAAEISFANEGWGKFLKAYMAK